MQFYMEHTGYIMTVSLFLHRITTSANETIVPKTATLV